MGTPRDMASLRRPKKKSRKDRAAAAAKKAAKGTALVKVAKRTPPRRLPLFAGVALAALVAIRLMRGRGGQPATA